MKKKSEIQYTEKGVCVICGRNSSVTGSFLETFTIPMKPDSPPNFFLNGARGAMYYKRRKIQHETFDVCIPCFDALTFGRWDTVQDVKVIRSEAFAMVQTEIGHTLPRQAQQVVIAVSGRVGEVLRVVRLPAGSIRKKDNKIYPFSAMYSSRPDQYSSFLSKYVVIVSSEKKLIESVKNCWEGLPLPMLQWVHGLKMREAQGVTKFLRPVEVYKMPLWV